MKRILFLIPVLLTLLISCKTREKQSNLNYVQNIEQIATDVALKNSHSTIQAGDQLIILFTSRDNDVVKPFNQTYSSSELVQNAMVTGNTPSAGNVTISGPSYLVDSDGNIEINVIGKVNTYGKTISELKDELHTRISAYVKNPTVNIRLANFRITVLGEVTRPSEYTISDAQATLFKALGLAGDLTIYGRRDNVLILRNENGQITKERINLTDANFISSPYYYLKQGDVIIVSANENKEITARTNPNLGIYISVASVAVGALAIVLSVLK